MTTILLQNNKKNIYSNKKNNYIKNKIKNLSIISSVLGNFLIWKKYPSSQERIQDLSDGWARIISEQKNPDFGTKRRASDENLL